MVRRPAPPRRAMEADASQGRFEARDAAHRRRNPDGTAGVATQGAERRAGHHRDARAPGGAADGIPGVPGVHARAEMSVLTVSVGRELIHVKCAEVDRTRLVEAPDGGRRDRGRLDEHAGPDRRDPPLPVEGVLVGQRYPVQRPPPTPRCHLSVGAFCHLQGAVGLNADVTVEFRLELGDALEHRLRERSRREVAPAQRGAGRREGEFGDWDVH